MFSFPVYLPPAAKNAVQAIDNQGVKMVFGGSFSLGLVLFGQDMANAIRSAHKMGMKDRMQISVPNLTIGMAERGGSRAMEGGVGTLPWCWQIRYTYNYTQGIKFVEDFQKEHHRDPSASAYAIMYEYKSAVERAGEPTRLEKRPGD